MSTLTILLIVGVIVVLGVVSSFIYLKIQKDEENWKVEYRGTGTGTFGRPYTDKYDTKRSMVFILEKNIETGERRAYAKDPEGNKQTLDVDWVIIQLQQNGADIK